MSIHPNPAQMRDTCAALRVRLHGSLSHLIFEAAAEEVRPCMTEAALRQLCLEGEAGPSPVVFALHGALLRAVRDGAADAVAARSADLAALTAQEAQMPREVTCLGWRSDALGDAAWAALDAAFADDIGLTTALHAPARDELAAAQRIAEQALATLAACAPDWHEELAMLAPSILFAVPAPGAPGGFGGASSFDAFGALLANARVHTSPARSLLELVHEASHQHMFLFHLEDPILLNDAEARYPSPLRAEPRPMEGLFHAAWVSARMALAAGAVLSARGGPDWADELRAGQERAIAAFRDCAGVVTAHAQFTPRGAALFAGAVEAVDAL